MERVEFLTVKHYLWKTQNEMARLLGCTPKAIELRAEEKKYSRARRASSPQFLYLKKIPDVRFRP